MALGTVTDSGLVTSIELLPLTVATNGPPTAVTQGVEVNSMRNADGVVPQTVSLIIASEAAPNGSITAIDAGSIDAGVDTDTFILDDGVNAAVTFAFDDDASVVETATLRAINHTGVETATEMRDLIVAAINAAPTLAITAEAGVAATLVTLVNDVVGAPGDVVITETVADAGFTVAGMATPSGVLTVTCRMWGWSPVASLWVPLGTGTGAAKGIINDGSAIDETGSDLLRHAEPVDLLGQFSRLYLEVTAIGGTATAVRAWLVAQN